MNEFERAVHGFVAAYPHWNEMDARWLTHRLTRRFNRQLTIDSNYVIHLVGELWEYTSQYCSRRSKKIQDIRREFVRNAACRHRRFWDVKGLEISQSLLDDEERAIERLMHLKSEMSASLVVFQGSFSRERITSLFNQFGYHIDLTKRESELFSIMKDVAQTESNFDEFWDEVEIRIFEEGALQINKVNFTTIKSRLLKKLKAREQQGSTTLLHYAPARRRSGNGEPELPGEISLFIRVLDDFGKRFENNSNSTNL